MTILQYIYVSSPHFHRDSHLVCVCVWLSVHICVTHLPTGIVCLVRCNKATLKSCECLCCVRSVPTHDTHTRTCDSTACSLTFSVSYNTLWPTAAVVKLDGEQSLCCFIVTHDARRVNRERRGRVFLYLLVCCIC